MLPPCIKEGHCIVLQMICRRSAASGSHLAASWGTGDASFQANLVQFRLGWIRNLVIRVPALKTSGIKFQTQAFPCRISFQNVGNEWYLPIWWWNHFLSRLVFYCNHPSAAESWDLEFQIPSFRKINTTINNTTFLVQVFDVEKRIQMESGTNWIFCWLKSLWWCKGSTR